MHTFIGQNLLGGLVLDDSIVGPMTPYIPHFGD